MTSFSPAGHPDLRGSAPRRHLHCLLLCSLWASGSGIRPEVQTQVQTAELSLEGLSFAELREAARTIRAQRASDGDDPVRLSPHQDVAGEDLHATPDSPDQTGHPHTELPHVLEGHSAEEGGTLPLDSAHDDLAHSSGSHGEEVHHAHGYVAMLFFFGTMLIGSMILMFLERYHLDLPYTLALFLAGVLVEVFKNKVGDSLKWQLWTDSVNMWEKIDPHTLLFAFLPALLFAEAMKLNSQLVATCLKQVLLLACPGVLLGTALTGAVAYYVLALGSWPICLAFGSILAATDPVAVVALFNTLGVSPRLTMIISGESLLNDGTAIVCFSLMLKIALGTAVTPAGMLLFFGEMTLPAFLWGGVTGFVATYLIGLCAEFCYHSDAMIQVVITICCGYAAFFVAEAQFSTSGVLATVASGYVVSYFCWPRFANRETMHIVWEAIEFVGNTVIFFLAGLLFGHVCLSRRHFIGGQDVVNLVLLYVLLLFIRAFMVMLFWPVLNMLGTPFSKKEGLVMVWSGLRGAVSLALAIIVDLEPDIDPEVGSLFMFHVGGIAALTFCINSASAAWLLSVLGLTRASPARAEVLQRLSKYMTDKTRDACDDQFSGSSEDTRFTLANPALVKEMLQLDAIDGTIDVDGDGVADVGTASVAGMSEGGSEPMQFGAEDVEEMCTVYREIWLRMVQHHYWEAIEEGIIPKTLKVARMLLHSTDGALDNIRNRLNDWDFLDEYLQQPPLGSVAFFMRRVMESRPFTWIPFFQVWFAEQMKSMEAVSAMEKAYVVLSFIEAHTHAAHGCKTKNPVNRVAQDRVAQESEDQRQLAFDFVQSYDPDFCEFAQSEMLTRKLLRQHMTRIEHMQHTGLISPSEASSMTEGVLKAARKIAKNPQGVWKTNDMLGAASRISIGHMISNATDRKSTATSPQAALTTVDES